MFLRVVITMGLMLVTACSGSGNGNGTDAGTDTGAGCGDACIPGLGVSAQQLRDFAGGRSGILVWVDAGKKIQVLDFRVAEPEVRGLNDDTNCINPLVSPDGTRVVYSTGQPSAPKFIHVASLDGTAKQQIAVGDIGYWYVAGTDEYIVYCDNSDKNQNGADGNTYRQKLVTGGVQADGDAETIHDRAMDAGPDKNLVWLGQVYDNLWAYNLQTQQDYPTGSFRLMGGGEADHQSCNGSMAPDGSGRLMCLVIPHDYVRVYTHDPGSDTFLQTSELRLPEGMAEWEFPDWSTDPGYFTAVLRASDLKNRLFVVKLAEGDGVPDTLEITGEETGASYSHLYLE